ncbi:peptidylprolyl isomerase [Candidatus Steffania adelgidicola]|uniref:peptidylprolyl isomerase n=1 Tax=Candidatus Steffania adelgidicola TaxID=1076626 RepID=UPI001D0157C1|nr:peptidylprolyl isomerase [Candidatus Steffania adelgidicola]UDG79813.1 Peptidyl-prolyl cis-trans isomerase D [Candidatus Steffania adelgidicola]
MMDNLRAAANHVIFKILLSLIALSFMLTGMGNYLTNHAEGEAGYAATVNGEKISSVHLENMVENERNRQKKFMGEELSELTRNEGYIRQQILSKLIDTALLEQYATKLGLTISDDQIKQEIFAIPAFRTDNKFDNVKFRFLINKISLSPVQYAALIRKHLLTQQLIKRIGETDFLLPTEIDRLLALVLQTREARLATFNIASLEDKQTASAAEIEAIYNTHKNQMLSPELFKVSYISMDAKSIEKKTVVNAQEIQYWYDQHQEQFTIPTNKRYSIIQSQTENDANTWLKKLHQGENFTSLAKAHSTDIISAKNGGDIGWISDRESPDELKQANLTKKGQLSGVIKSSVGFIIVRLEDLEPSKLTPLDAVRDKVLAKVKHEKAINAYYALLQKVKDAINNDNATLVSAEISSGIKAKQTDWFTRDDVPKSLNYDLVKEVLFNGSLVGKSGASGSNANIITIDNGCALVFRITDHRPERQKQIDEVHTELEREVKRYKAIKQATLEAKKALASLKQNHSSKALQVIGLTFSAPQYFDSVNQGNPVVAAVFKLQPPPLGKSSYGMVTNTNGDIVLISLDKIRSKKLNAKQRQVFVQQLIQGMKGVTFDALLVNLRAAAKITITEVRNR